MSFSTLAHKDFLSFWTLMTYNFVPKMVVFVVTVLSSPHFLHRDLPHNKQFYSSLTFLDRLFCITYLYSTQYQFQVQFWILFVGLHFRYQLPTSPVHRYLSRTSSANLAIVHQNMRRSCAWKASHNRNFVCLHPPSNIQRHRLRLYSESTSLHSPLTFKHISFIRTLKRIH